MKDKWMWEREGEGERAGRNGRRENCGWNVCVRKQLIFNKEIKEKKIHSSQKGENG